jgi:hypothetical protein
MSSTTFIGRRVIVRDALTQPATEAAQTARGSAWCQCDSPSCSGGRTGGGWLSEAPTPAAVGPRDSGPRDARRLRGPGRGAVSGLGPGR